MASPAMATSSIGGEEGRVSPPSPPSSGSLAGGTTFRGLAVAEIAIDEFIHAPIGRRIDLDPLLQIWARSFPGTDN